MFPLKKKPPKEWKVLFLGRWCTTLRQKALQSTNLKPFKVCFGRIGIGYLSLTSFCNFALFNCPNGSCRRGWRLLLQVPKPSPPSQYDQLHCSPSFFRAPSYAIFGIANSSSRDSALSESGETCKGNFLARHGVPSDNLACLQYYTAINDFSTFNGPRPRFSTIPDLLRPSSYLSRASDRLDITPFQE